MEEPLVQQKNYLYHHLIQISSRRFRLSQQHCPRTPCHGCRHLVLGRCLITNSFISKPHSIPSCSSCPSWREACDRHQRPWWNLLEPAQTMIKPVGARLSIRIRSRTYSPIARPHGNGKNPPGRCPVVPVIRGGGDRGDSTGAIPARDDWV